MSASVERKCKQARPERERERVFSCVCFFEWNVRAHAKEYVERNFKLASHGSVMLTCSLSHTR